MVDHQTIRAINQALDHRRRVLALPNDSELARSLGISSKTLSFIRKGRLSKTSAVVANVLIRPASTPTHNDSTQGAAPEAGSAAEVASNRG